MTEYRHVFITTRHKSKTVIQRMKFTLKYDENHNLVEEKNHIYKYEDFTDENLYNSTEFMITLMKEGADCFITKE